MGCLVWWMNIIIYFSITPILSLQKSVLTHLSAAYSSLMKSKLGFHEYITCQQTHFQMTHCVSGVETATETQSYISSYEK